MSIFTQLISDDEQRKEKEHKESIDIPASDYSVCSSVMNDMKSWPYNPIQAIVDTEESKFGLALDTYNRVNFKSDLNGYSYNSNRSDFMLCITGGSNFNIKPWDNCWPELRLVDVRNCETLREAIQVIETNIVEIIELREIKRIAEQARIERERLEVIRLEQIKQERISARDIRLQKTCDTINTLNHDVLVENIWIEDVTPIEGKRKEFDAESGILSIIVQDCRYINEAFARYIKVEAYCDYEETDRWSVTASNKTIYNADNEEQAAAYLDKMRAKHISQTKRIKQIMSK